MTTLARIWLEFAACTAVIGLAGTRLTRYGDALAGLTGMSRSWVGLVLIATVTSLPELVTGLSAVTVAAAPDMAIGDALGSCVFNLVLVAMVDLVHRRAPLFLEASRVHLVSASFGIGLLAMTGAAIALRDAARPWAIAHVSLASVGLLLCYAIAMRTLYRAEQAQSARPLREPPTMGMRQALTGYALAAIVIVAAGLWLPLVGVQLARAMGWTDSFVGTLFIALATSVPEVATTLAAVRIGAVDIALGNLLGSNLFDLLIVALDDMAFVQGPIFDRVSMLHLSSVATAVLMNCTVIAALWLRPRRRLLELSSWAGLALVALFGTNAVIQYFGSP